MSHFAPFLTGFGLSLGLIVAIGAQNAFVLRQGLRREHVGAVVAFCALADLALIAAGVAGLGAGLGRAPALVTGLSLGGAAFLGWYGLSALRRALHPARLVAETGGEALTRAGALARVAAFTFLNPHVYLDTVLLVGSVGAAQPWARRGPSWRARAWPAWSGSWPWASGPACSRRSSPGRAPGGFLTCWWGPS